MSLQIETAPRAATLLARFAASRPGRWIVPANVCLAAPLGLMSGGAKVEVIDIHPETLCLAPELVRTRLGTNTEPIAGILYVRTYGQTAHVAGDLARLRDVLGPEGLLIDDACLSMPVTDPDTALMPEADALIYSTGPRKPVDLGGGAFAVLGPRAELGQVEGDGDGQAFDAFQANAQTAVAPLLTDPQAPEIASLLRRWLPVGPGPAWPELRAEIEAVLPRREAHAGVLNAIYGHGLAGFKSLPVTFQSWRYQVMVDEADAALEALFEAGLFASRHYRPIDTLFAGLPAPEAHRLYSRVLNLFNDHNSTSAQAQRAVEVLRPFARTPRA